MVLIAAAICTKSGKTIISRQFVEMTKARIEGLLAAFPKLMVTGKQHTFVETDSVRYVYQPLEKLYMLLITTKASNILEDLETLRLFSKVTPEYCRTLDEKEILENAFELIFAFDEIIALGYRESVNLSQIKTFVEMDSHEEKLFQAVRQTQEREAKQKMREKAKELQMQRLEANRKGLVGMGRGGGGGSGGFGGGSSEGFGSGMSSMSSGGGAVGNNNNSSSSIINDVKSSSSSATSSRPAPSRNAMKLGGKTKDVDSFVDQLKNEGEKIASLKPTMAQSNSAGGGASVSSIQSKPKPVSDVPMEAVHLKVEDKLQMSIGRDGGLQQFELSGLLTLRVSDERFGRIRLRIDNQDNALAVQMQTHPNVDKELFRQQNQIGLKNPAKPFPINTDVGVLKWRLQTQEDTAVPLQINCWPSENGEGGCDVNIEYELEHKNLELQDVVIAIPLPMNVAPTIAECDGDYKHESRKNLLLWTLPVINGSSKQGAMEFSVPSSIPGDFFPIQVSFHSKTSYARLKALEVVGLQEDGTPADAVTFSTETYFYPEKYEIV